MPDFLDLHGRTSKQVRALTEARLQRHGLHLGQDRLLAELWERDGRTPGEIATAVGVTTPAVVKMAGRMVEAGWIAKRGDERDSRLVRLWLTDAGRALRDPVEAERRWVDEQITADLTADERRDLIAALAKVHAAARALAAD